MCRLRNPPSARRPDKWAEIVGAGRGVGVGGQITRAITRRKTGANILYDIQQADWKQEQTVHKTAIWKIDI